MLALSISPSTQDKNLCVDGTAEEFNMNKLATDVLAKLTPVSFVRNDPNKDARAAIRLANQNRVKLHLALHSNAGGGSGVEAYYDPSKPKSKKLAEELCRVISLVTGVRNRGAKDGRRLIEINGARKDMDAVLVECFFHDNKEDVKKYRVNYSKVVNEIAWQLKLYFGIK